MNAPISTQTKEDLESTMLDGIMNAKNGGLKEILNK